MIDKNTYHHLMCRLDTGQCSVAVIFLALFLWITAPAVYGQSARVSSSKQAISTYPFGDPSPVPILTEKPEVYPYFRFDGYSTTSQDKKWKVITLENEHIKLSVLPEVGGKIFGAVDKSTGKEFIYKNDVLKFRDIGLRGPWASGGIEFNFGYIGHTPSTSTPVDYITKENEDGSVSVFVGGLDLASRTKWRVEIRLPEDKALFKTNSFWYNPTPFHQSYYQWMNAAIAAGDDLQMYFPGTNHIFHDGKGETWPVSDEGNEISRYKNNQFGGSKSYHVLGKYQDYSAAYWHDSDFGYGHWARHDEMPGQKVWMWAQSRAGAIWEDLLTDSAGQYVEVQSGRLFNQANLNSGLATPFDQYLFQPQTVDSWSEYWFPISETGGVSDASPYGTLHVQRDEQALSIRFHAIQEIEDTLEISIDGRQWKQEKVELQPNTVYNKEVHLPSEVEEYSVNIGNHLQYHYPENDDLQRPIEAGNESNINSVENTFQRAEEHLGLRKFGTALSLYKQVIKEVPDHRWALTRIAELYTRHAEYEKALPYVIKVLKEDTYDASANYVYGVLKRKLGAVTQAKDAFSWAARSMKYRSAGFAQMAELYLLERNWKEAIYYANKALDFNTYNMAARKAKVIAYRLSGEKKQAQQELDEMLDIDPLSHFARFEQYLLEPNESNRRHFISLIRNEMPHETYLELAINYYDMERTEEAKEVLSLAPDNAIVQYWQAFLRRNDPVQPKQYLQEALSQSPHLGYPFRSETMEVLNWAIQQNQQWQPKYYLGLIMWHKGRKEQAISLFKACKNDPDFVPFYLTRGQLLQESNPQQAGKDFKHALQLDERRWRSYRALGQWFVAQDSIERALPLLKKAFQKFPDNYYLGMQYVSILNDSRQFGRALDILNDLTVLPYEGAQRGHKLYEQAHLMLALESVVAGNLQNASNHLAKSRQWPEHLGVGRPYNPDNRFQDYLEAHINRQQENEQKAANFEQNILSYTNGHWDAIKSGVFTKDNYVSYLVLSRKGNKQKAKKLLNNFREQLGHERFNQLKLEKGVDGYSSARLPKSTGVYWLQLLREARH